MGTMTTEEFTTGCAGSNFPLYFPGGQTTCMGTGGASANFLLDARVIAGLVVVGIALLSL